VNREWREWTRRDEPRMTRMDAKGVTDEHG
jgi:hypothetical protein